MESEIVNALVKVTLFYMIIITYLYFLCNTKVTLLCKARRKVNMSYLYQKPIEMPRGTHYGSDYWIAYSYKLKRMVHLYSMLEYANFITLEMDVAVEFFCEQPLKIEDLHSSTAKQVSVFDFWVQYKDSAHEFQEVKYSSELTDTTDSAMRSQQQIEFQRNWCLSNGHTYRVITEKDLYLGQFWIQNLELLHSHLLRYNPSERNDLQRLYNILESKSLSLEEIMSLKVLPLNYEWSVLAHQFYTGKINMNLKDRPLDNYTEVSLCETKNITF